MSECRDTERFRNQEHCWIEMPDGIRLAARIWMPENALTRPAPAIFEYIPYRKGDMVRARDERNHPYLAQNGFVALRVDMRGSGDSEGQMPDMYGQAELDDARHVIDWLARQPWCNGKVGMFGTSWGGTASLQANIDAPEALKAVIAVCATHDRYEDDIHHMGGCMLTDSVEWGATLPTILGAPPSTNVGGAWREMWEERLDALSFPLEAWLRNEDRGEYWRHGSVIHQADRLHVPILCVGGWADRYSNSIMSLVDRRPDLAWGIVGPWGHHYPDQGHPGPGIGFQKVMLDWWRHWLGSDSDTCPEWPKLRTWVREFDTPADAIDIRNGGWVETGPPSDMTSDQAWHLADTGLTKHPAGIRLDLPFDLRVGVAAADTGYFGRFGGLPPDQKPDDLASLCFDTEPLEHDRVIYGAASLELEFTSSTPKAQMCLRMNDVAPDGTSVRITWAVRNLALNDDLDAPEETLPDGRRAVLIRFPTMAYRLKAGHRLRLAVSQSYWPMIWTPPVIGKVTLLGGCLKLPIARKEPAPIRTRLPEAEDLPVEKSYTVDKAPQIVRTPPEIKGDVLRSGWHQPFTSVRYHDIDTRFGYETQARFRLRPNDPLTAICVYDHRMIFERPDGTAAVACEVTLTSDADAYHVTGTFSATWEDEVVTEHEWSFKVPRVLA